MIVMVTFVPSQMSGAVGGVNVHTSPHSTMRLLAQVMMGAVVSITVMVWLHEALLLQLSVACQVRMASNVFPHNAFVIVPVMVIVAFVPSQTSVAEGASNVHTSPHSTMRLLAQVMSGAVVSTTVMVWLHEALLLQLSVACQVRMASNVFPHSALVIVPVMVIVAFVPSQTSVAEGA